jgi:cysteine-rich repeat protein
LGTGEFNPYFGEPVALGGAEVTLPGCGDGAIGVGEQCDDGNVSDGDGCSASCMLENTPPDCMGAAASLGSLWPPNHKYVSIGIEGVSDPDGDPVSVAITSIFQDEPTETIGDGNNCPDATGTGTDTASIRSERSGTRKVPGDGRVYHIGFTADDGAGGECSGVVTVCVPHDRGGAPACVDQGALFDSTLCGDR